MIASYKPLSIAARLKISRAQTVTLNLEFQEEDTIKLVELSRYVDLLCSGYKIAQIDPSEALHNRILQLIEHGWSSREAAQLRRSFKRLSPYISRQNRARSKEKRHLTPILVHSIAFNSPLRIRVTGLLVPLLTVMILSGGVIQLDDALSQPGRMNAEELNVQLPNLETSSTHLEDSGIPSGSEKKP